MIIIRVNWNLDYHWRLNSRRRESSQWQADRERLFQCTALASLQRQIHQQWRLWLRCDPALHHLTDDMPMRCEDKRVSVTYDIDHTARQCAERYGSDPEGVIFGRLDSDDMLHPGALARWNQETSPGLIQFGDGYALELPGGRLFEWNHPSSPFIAEIAAQRSMRAGVPDLGGNHGQVHQLARSISDRRWYIVTLHGGNVCNSADSRWCGPELTGPARHQVLKEFQVGPIEVMEPVNA